MEILVRYFFYFLTLQKSWPENEDHIIVRICNTECNLFEFQSSRPILAYI